MQLHDSIFGQIRVVLRRLHAETTSANQALLPTLSCVPAISSADSRSPLISSTAYPPTNSATPPSADRAGPPAALSSRRIRCRHLERWPPPILTRLDVTKHASALNAKLSRHGGGRDLEASTVMNRLLILSREALWIIPQKQRTQLYASTFSKNDHLA